MKIMMMTNTYTPIVGGIERSIESFKTMLEKKGHQVVIIAPEYSDQPENERGVFRLPAIRNFNGTDFSVNLPIPSGLTEVIKQFNPDIIHSHHPFLMGDLALRMAQSNDIPLVFTYHTNFEDYTHYLPLDNEASKKFITELSVGYANLCDLVITPSESVRLRLFERGLRKPTNIVPTGVETPKSKRFNSKAIRKKYKFPEFDRILGFVGRLEPEKNIQFLVKAVAAYLAEHRDTCFVVVGEGSLKDEMRQVFREQNVDEQVCFTGSASKEEVTKISSQFDVFVFASKSETQGIVIVEALSLGIPVVALDGPGIRECVLDGENGRLVMSENLKDYLNAIHWCLTLSSSRLRKVRKSAIQTAEKFSLENTSETLLQTYDSVAYIPKTDSKNGFLTWEKAMDRIQVEWRMMANLSKSTVKAIREMVEPHPDKNGSSPVSKKMSEKVLVE